jgi:hypothetical protein
MTGQKLTCWSCASWDSRYDLERMRPAIFCRLDILGFPNRGPGDCPRFEYEPGADEAEAPDVLELKVGRS